MSLVGAAIPTAVWRWQPVLSAIGHVAGRALGADRVRLTGQTSNGQHFDANPLRIWYVTVSSAIGRVYVDPAAPARDDLSVR